MEVNSQPDVPGWAHPFPKEIRTLTSLRCIAAGWVVLFHWSHYFLQSGLSNMALARQGFLGVDFFFILSGFVLAHVYLDRQRNGKLDYWNFLTRRIARIYPMHALMLIVMIAFGLVAARMDWTFSAWNPAHFVRLPRGELLREMMGQVLLIHAWGASDGLQFNLPSWSISAEWFAYLIFPLVTMLLKPAIRRPVLTLTVIIAAVLIFFYAVRGIMGLPLFKMTWNVGILRIFPSFVFGVALYLFGLRYSAGRYAKPAFLLAVVATITAVMVQLPLPVVVLTFGPLILLAADSERNGGLALACRPFPVLLGEVSYAVYMLHFGFGIVLFDLVLPQFRDATLFPAMVSIAGGLVLVNLLSWIAHIWFEHPVRNWINTNASRVMKPQKKEA